MKKISSLLTMTLFTLSAQAQVDLTKGLMLYLPFNGNTLDASSNGNHAVNYGATLTTDQWGRANNAYYFNGSSAYMQIPNSPTLQPNTAITLSARVNVQAFYNGICYNNCIIDKGLGDREYGNYTLRFSGSTNDCYTADTNAQNYVGFFNDQGPLASTSATTPHVPTSTWDCLIFTYDGSMAKMYVNGILRHQYPSTSVIGTNSLDVFLGRKDQVGYPYRFNGLMDEVRIYDRALNTAEIDSLCSNILPLGIAEPGIKQLPVFQNPIVHELELTLTQAELGGNLQVLDMTGRALLHIESLHTLSIPLGDIPAGLYFVTYCVGADYMRAKILKR